MKRKAILVASLLILSVILVAGLLTNDTATVNDGGVVASSDHPNASLDAGFDGTKYSSQASPRTTSEMLSGKKEMTFQSILAGGTSTLSIDIPSGWSPIDLSTKVYQLYENRSFARNPDFSTGYTQGGKSYPNYWTNWSFNSGALKAEWNNGSAAQDVYFEMMDGINLYLGDTARWTQLVYVNGTNLDQAKLSFKIKKSPGDLGGGNNGKVLAEVYVNQLRVFRMVYSNSSFLTTYTQQVVDVTGAVSSLPGNVNVTLSMGFNAHAKLSGVNGSIYYDDVYLYINSTRFPQAVNLTLNGAPVVGQQYGTGVASLHGALATPFLFASNTTGRVKFICNSTISIRGIGQSDTANFTVTQGLPVNQNVTKLSFFSSSTYIFGYTNYTRDIFNVSIPYDWTYSRLILPNGTAISGLSAGLIQKYQNGSYSWIIMINATGIRSYRPAPYTVAATSINYLGAISTFRSSAGNWVAGDFFTNGSRIKINATVQGSSGSKGGAHVVFYNSSTNAVWRDMSPYPATAGNDGNVSFSFKWSNNLSGGGANISRSDLITLVVWNNGTEVGAKWVSISFDLTPPQPMISGATPGQVVGGVSAITMSCVDAHFKNVTLFINGTAVDASSTPPSGTTIYSWNTKTYSDGPWEIKVRGWDQVDHVDETKLMVYVDNTPPSLQASLPAAGTYARGEVPLAISWRDPHPKNVSLFINRSLLLSLPGNLSAYNWNSELVGDGVVNLTVIAWDVAGNFNETTSQVIVDNTPPVLAMSLSTTPQQVSGNSYVAGNFTLNLSCVDSHFKNLTLLIDGQSRGSWTYSSPSYRWNTTAYSDGAHTLTTSAWDLAGNNNETTLYRVYVDNTPPSLPGLSFPNDGDTVNVATPTLVWNGASDSGSGVDHYILELDTSPYFNSTNHRVLSNIKAANYSVPSDQPLSGGAWYWRVRAVDTVGNVGQYTTARSFQVSLPGLPVALLVGIAGVVPTVVILSSLVLLRRRRKTEAEVFYRRNLIAAYVFSKDGRCMFTHQFKEVNIEPQLLSGFLTAISGMMKEVVGGAGRQLSTIERPDAKILLEFGDSVTGALVAKKSSPEYRRRLRAFLSRFEHDYAEKIVKWDGRDIFEDASEIVEEVFAARVKVTTYPTILGIEDLLVEKKIGGVAISVAGKTGSGKSTFCLRHAASLLKRGHPVIIIDGSMPPKNVRKELGTTGVDADKLEEQGLLILYDAYSEISGIESKEKYKLGSPGELNTINLSLSRNLGKLKSATVFFDSLTAMIEYSDPELAVDFIRTVKVKLQEGDHTAFFIIDSNAHDQSTLNYINHVMDGEIETTSRRTRTGGTERLVSFKRLNGYEIRTGYHQIQ